MNKQELIKELVEILNNYKAIELGFATEFEKNPLESRPELVDFIYEEWSVFKNLFPKLNKVKKFLLIDDKWTGNIYEDFSLLENLKEFYFHNSDLSETEKYIEEGLAKLSKLENIWFAGTNLKNFPKVILTSLPNLKSLGIIGNKFYKQNIHFKLNRGCENLYSKLYELLEEKNWELLKANRAIEDELDKMDMSRIETLKYAQEKINYNYDFIKYDWGLYNSKTNILILKDDFLNTSEGINSLSIYVLNENKQDKYEIFSTYNNLFLELNEKLKCFKISQNKYFELFFYNKNDHNEYIEFTNLLEFYKSKVDKYKGFITEDLIKELGGKRLLEEIKNSQQTGEKQIAKEFYDKNNYIESISIENFKIFKEKQTINNLDNVNIVVGKNAEGKTSLLQAIAASLIPKLSNDIKNYKTLININAYKSENDYAKTEVVWNGGYSKRQRITDRGIINENKKEKELPISYLVLAYGENLYAKEKPVESYQDILKTGNYKSYHTEAIFNTTFDKMVNPLDLLYELSEGQIKEVNSEFKNELLEIAQLIKEKLNKLLKSSEAHHFVIEKEGAYYKFFDIKKEIFIDFEQISEGYRSYVILLSDIIFRMLAARNDLLINGFKKDKILDKVKGTIIIDEFDKHMHPAWQRTFLKTLKTEFPLIQFFLSTHNIIALQSAETEKALIVNQQKIEPKIIHLGQSIEAIYNEYFEGSNIFGETTEVKFNNFKKRLKQIDIEEVNTDKELNRLREELICNNNEMEIILQCEIGQERKQNDKTK